VSAGAGGLGGSNASAGASAAAGATSGGTGSTAPLPAHDAGGVGDPINDASVDAGQVGSRAARRIASPPSYLGSVSNGAACDRRYDTRGFEPDTPQGTRHPLFLYFSGTNFVLDRDAFRAQIAPGAEAVTQAMAQRGFVALQADYDNDPLSWASDHSGLLGCLFSDASPESLLAAACALPQVDCELGIATWGHSLGALVAHRAANGDSRVRAAWTTGYGGDATATLPVTRLRVVNGEHDTTNGSVPALNSIAGFDQTECPDDGRSQCLRPDGSGWILVRQADCERSSADHCWFDKQSCADATTVLEPTWIDPTSTRPFALAANADWLALVARSP
jgi:hypothetical protein